MMTPRIYEYCGLASQLAAEAPGSLRWRYFLVLLDETWEDLSLEERILLDLITDAQEVADHEVILQGLYAIGHENPSAQAIEA